MFYEIAGLKVEVGGSCLLEKQTVTFVKRNNAFVYTRKENIALNENTNEMSSGEKLSPDDACFSVRDAEYEKEGIEDLTDDEITAVISGSEPCDKQGNSAYIVRRMAAYAAKNMEGAAPDVFVPDFRIQYKMSAKIERPAGEEIQNVRGFTVIRRENGVISFLRTIKELEEILVRIDFSADFTEANMEVFDVSGLGGINLDIRLHSYIGEAFAYMALKKGRVVFHSSAIGVSNKGVCFSAPSGTGKSTHTGLWKTYYGSETEIINDDTPCLYVKDGQAYLCGTPWSGKTELNINKEIPLCGLVRLARSKENYIEKITGLNALKYFFAEAKIPELPEVFDSGLDTAGKILERVPMYLLGCNISKEAVDLVKETLSL